MMLLLLEMVHAACNNVELDFVVLAGEATHRAVEDNIRADLAKVGITAVARYLEKEDFNSAMVNGDYDMVFSETWGAPYDPHSYVASWTTPDEAHRPILVQSEPPLDVDTFGTWVSTILATTDLEERQHEWTDLLSAVHEDVIHLPLWGKRIPSVVNRQVVGYLPGQQQFEYPIWKVSGKKNLTVAPGAQTGLFTSVGPMDPHGYRPNEFFSNHWIYEGLVSYGPDGNIEASLASSWTSETYGEGQRFRFTLREGVTFHDGTEFNCSAVKLNFDHVFAPPLRGPDWHGWYGLPGSLADWHCDANVFVLDTLTPYYPLLQELTYIRPMRILSPSAFMNGIFTSPETHNSCPSSWGTIQGDDNYTVNCVGILAPVGTGPLSFASRVINADGSDDSVLFERNAHYWGGAPDVESVTIVGYEGHDQVYSALLNGELDAVLGAGVLNPDDLQAIQYNPDFEVLHGDPTQNTVIIMNIDDDTIRQVVVHAVNKNPIIQDDLGGFEEPVSQLFPISAPYCDVNLVPKLDYDLEKALLLNCPEESSSKKSTSTKNGPYVPLFAVAAVLVALLIGGMCYMARREREGQPMFAPLTNPLVEAEPKDSKDQEEGKYAEVELAAN